jgi:hypothetical protein
VERLLVPGMCWWSEARPMRCSAEQALHRIGDESNQRSTNAFSITK